MEFWRADSSQANQAHTDVGRWLFASLLLVHGGALVAIGQTGELAPLLLRSSAFWFVTGLILALVTGFVAWGNWRISTELFDEMAEPAYAVRPDLSPKPTRWKVWAQIGLMWLAVVLGLGSIACVAFGAHAVSRAVGQAPQSAGYELLRGNDETVFRLEKASGIVDACVVNDVEAACYALPRTTRLNPFDDLIHKK